MNSYTFKGTYRRQGAIGKSHRFVGVFSGDTPKLAMDEFRMELYGKGYDHILFTSCKNNATGKKIPMMKVLELE